MKKPASLVASQKRTPVPPKVKPVRDNVLGRRSSKTDPLGEQPGTTEKNSEYDEVKGKHTKGSDTPPQKSKKA